MLHNIKEDKLPYKQIFELNKNEYEEYIFNDLSFILNYHTLGVGPVDG